MEERGERELLKVAEEDRLRTPWWDELRRCAEGDFVPDKVEGWNHPISGASHLSSSSNGGLKPVDSAILAVSTAAPNPLQAIMALYNRSLQFPPWVDSNVLRYILIVHPQNTHFSDEEYVNRYLVTTTRANEIASELPRCSTPSRSNMDCIATFYPSPCRAPHPSQFPFPPLCRDYRHFLNLSLQRCTDGDPLPPL
jgi:hypothetical protein